MKTETTNTELHYTEGLPPLKGNRIKTFQNIPADRCLRLGSALRSLCVFCSFNVFQGEQHHAVCDAGGGGVVGSGGEFNFFKMNFSKRIDYKQTQN